MKSLKVLSVCLATLVGAGGLGLAQASAAPLADVNSRVEASGDSIELVHARKWKYDRKRHGERKFKRDRSHRFFFGGFWYGSPFWHFSPAPLHVNRLSCGEARRLVNRDRRFHRARTIECRGRIYTFAALNRRGRHVEVSVNSRTGNYWRS